MSNSAYSIYQPKNQAKGLSFDPRTKILLLIELDILLFLANNPAYNTAKDICQCRGVKPGIVSVHVDRLVNLGLLARQDVPGDRRKTRLVCTDQAAPLIARGRTQQQAAFSANPDAIRAGGI